MNLVRHSRHVASLALAVALGTGCAGLSHRVDRGLLDQVPNEELLLLFDAENAVYIAVGSPGTELEFAL